MKIDKKKTRRKEIAAMEADETTVRVYLDIYKDELSA